MAREIIVGTRTSALAVAQAQIVVDLLGGKGFELKIRKIKSGEAFGSVGYSRKDLFTRSIDEALVDGSIDVAVHSLKDVPSEKLQDGIEICAFPKRASPFDVLITKKDGTTLETLGKNSRVGTSSVRRAVQLKHFRPDLEIVEIHGNVETRIRKLDDDDDLDAIVLAKAGVERLNLDVHASVIPESVMLPAVGQGCLAVCVSSNCNPEIKEIVKSIDHVETRYAVLSERSFSQELGGGCNLPIAALGAISDNGRTLNLEGLIGKDSRVERDSVSGPVEEAELTGKRLAGKLRHIM